MRQKYVLAALCVAIGVSGLAAQVRLPNGTTVPKNRFILVVGAGSCNFVGMGSPLDTSTDPRCWAWGTGDQSDYWGKQEWVPLRDRIWSSVKAGCGMVQVVREMAARFPDFHFGAVQWARDYAGLRCGGADLSMMPPNNRGYRTLMNNARALAPNVTFGFVFFQFDALESQAAQQYQDSYAADFKTVIDSMRAGLGLTPAQLPALTNEYGANYTGIYAITSAGAARVAAQMLAIPSTVPYSATVSTTGLPVVDGHHFTGATWRLEAGRAVDTLLARNWLPWATTTATVAGDVAHRAPATLCRVGVRSLTIAAPRTADASATLTRLDGSLGRSIRLEGPGACRVAMVPGMYVVDIRACGGDRVERVPVR